jgi:fatty-acyl-CoA synthase
MEQFECSYVYGVPAMLIDLIGEVESNRASLTTLRYVITAATTVPLDLVQRTARLLPNLKSIQIVYGATELSPIVTAPPLAAPMMDNLDNVGVPLDFTEVKLIHPRTKQIVKIGEQGSFFFLFLFFYQFNNNFSMAKPQANC